MPYLTISSNQSLVTDSQQLPLLSKTVAETLNKPEAYVMVSIYHNNDMIFAGSQDPMAFCELKSLGLLETQTAELSKRLCESIHQLFHIPESRIYIEFSSPARAMWGWDSKTF